MSGIHIKNRTPRGCLNQIAPRPSLAQCSRMLSAMPWLILSSKTQLCDLHLQLGAIIKIGLDNSIITSTPPNEHNYYALFSKIVKKLKSPLLFIVLQAIPSPDIIYLWLKPKSYYSQRNISSIGIFIPTQKTIFLAILSYIHQRYSHLAQSPKPFVRIQ